VERPRWKVPDAGLLRPLGGGNVLLVAQEIDDLVRGVCRSPDVVDHVIDGADTAQGYGNQIVELDRGDIGYLESAGIDDARVDVEEAVRSQPPPLVGPDAVGHLVGGEAVYAVVRPSCLIRRVIGHLVLEHDRATVLAVPDDLVVLVVLHKKTVGGDIIPVHDQAVRGGVARPAHTGAMVGPPRPDVVYDHIVPVDLEAGGGFARSSTTDAEEYVLDQRGIIRLAPRASQDGKARQLADLEKNPRVNRTRIEDQARELHARDVGDLHRFFPPPWHQRWEAETQHHGVGPENADRLVEIVDAGRQDQMLAASQCIISFVHVVSRLRDEEVGDRDRRTERRSVSPSNS
jgi:hypothetical protein